MLLPQTLNPGFSTPVKGVIRGQLCKPKTLDLWTLAPHHKSTQAELILLQTALNHPLPAWPCHTHTPVATISLMITVVSSIYLPQKLVLHRAAQGVFLGHIFDFLLWHSV